MLTVKLGVDDFDSHGYVYVWRLARAVLDALGGTVARTEKTSVWFKEIATADTTTRERYPVMRERGVWEKIDAAALAGHLRPVAPDTHSPRERGDIADAVVSLDEVCKWGEWMGLYRFMADAGDKGDAVKVGGGGTAATAAALDKAKAVMQLKALVAAVNEGNAAETAEEVSHGGTARDELKQAAIITTHRLKTRSNPLDAVIALATKNAVAPDDSQSVYAEMVKLGESEDKPAPLIGYSSDGIQYRGKKYEETGQPDTFTAKNLRDRMARAKAR